MATVEGTHTQGVGGRQVRYRCTSEAVRNAIHFKASFDPGTPHEGEGSVAITSWRRLRR